jgi:hypothetical protein
MLGKKSVIALYGDVKLVRAWCNSCEAYSIVLNGILQCCNSKIDGKSTAQVRMSGKPNPGKEKQDSIREKRKRAVSIRDERLNQNGGSHTSKEWNALCKKYNYLCLCCGERKPLTKDHIVPVVLGGTDDIENIQPLCQKCNIKKHAKYFDYRQKFI